MLQIPLEIVVLQVLKGLPVRRGIEGIQVPQGNAVNLVLTGKMGQTGRLVRPVRLFQAKRANLDLRALQVQRESREVFRALRAKWALLERVERLDLVAQTARKALSG